MPAIDQCEENILHAFEKDDWKVVYHPFLIRFAGQRRKLFADAKLEQRQNGGANTAIIIEVKCFKQGILDEFYQAVGQYLFYRAALALAFVEDPLYLVVPEPVYQSLFQVDAAQLVISQAKIKIATVELSQEVIVQWIT